MKNQTFLIKATSGREAIMRLPVGKYGAMTTKGLKMIQDRFYEGATNTRHGLQYALNIETFSNGQELLKAIERYNKNTI